MGHHVGHMALVLDLGEELQRLVGQTLFGQCVEHLHGVVEQPIAAPHVMENLLQVLWVLGVFYCGLLAEGVVRGWEYPILFVGIVVLVVGFGV